MERRSSRSVLLAAVLAAGACGRERQASPPAPPEPQLATLTELQAAVKRNLERGALVSFWATW